MERLKRHGINCLQPKRIMISGKIRVFCFDKTGTLTKEGLDFVGFQPPVSFSLFFSFFFLSEKKGREEAHQKSGPSPHFRRLFAAIRASYFGLLTMSGDDMQRLRAS